MSKGDYTIKEKACFIYYGDILRAYGNMAKHIPKKQLYRETGSMVFLSAFRAGEIIKKMLREGYTPTPIDIEDVERLRCAKNVIEH